MEPARAGLRKIMSDLLRAQPAAEAVLMAWPLVCGKEVAARSQAVAFSDGKLSVEVPDATWRTQLQSFAPRYLSEYESLLGPMLRGIEFKVRHSAISTQQSAKPVSSASPNPAPNAHRRVPSTKKMKRAER